MKDAAKAGVIMLLAPKFDVICVIYVYLRMDVQLSSWSNSESNYIVKQSANSIRSEFLFGEQIDMHAYSGNRWEWSTSVFLFFSVLLQYAHIHSWTSTFLVPRCIHSLHRSVCKSDHRKQDTQHVLFPLKMLGTVSYLYFVKLVNEESFASPYTMTFLVIAVLFYSWKWEIIVRRR